MSLKMKAKMLKVQGKTDSEILKEIIDEGDRKIQSLDLLLADFVENSPKELVDRLIPFSD